VRPRAALRDGTPDFCSAIALYPAVRRLHDLAEFITDRAPTTKSTTLHRPVAERTGLPFSADGSPRAHVATHEAAGAEAFRRVTRTACALRPSAASSVEAA
jgi:hypothetical protein